MFFKMVAKMEFFIFLENKIFARKMNSCRENATYCQNCGSGSEGRLWSDPGGLSDPDPYLEIRLDLV